MDGNANRIPFSLNYNALKMFGRQLYSNAWAALSELVANGFDAGAPSVYLFINMINKKRAIIELMDNGSGMDEEDLREKYVIIGRNRRLENPKDRAAGRKGIGKLAALYLSDNYKIISKKNETVTAWSVDVTGVSDNTKPSLERVSIATINVECEDIWHSSDFTKGTLIQLCDVDLSRIGDAAIEALKHKLSNYFLFDKIENSLKICIIRDSKDPLIFESVKKQIAFDNLTHVYCSKNAPVETTRDSFEIKYTNKLGTSKTVLIKREVRLFPSEVSDQRTKEKISIKGSHIFNGVEKAYELIGWMGVHASIEKGSALSNDSRYIRNQFYNPNQIRVYVRNKLANENMLDKLALVGTYANYIEGEISFDVLDDNDLEDIATSNRQDFSVIDERVSLLRTLLRGIAVQLLARRQEIADLVNKTKKEEDDIIRAKEKTTFVRELHEDLVAANVETETADRLSPVIANKLKGNFELKSTYKLFISHSKSDRIFTDFITHYLMHRGFKWSSDPEKTDIFYTSDGLDITNLDPLAETIKKMILDHNTDILFFSSKSFLQSQYCLFEGGATWATRAIMDYSIISVDYESIPKFLTNGKPEFTFNSRDKTSFELNEQNYTNIVTILNRIIKHLNTNRILKGLEEIEEIPFVKFRDKVQLQKEGKKLRDYLDKDVCVYWDTYVLNEIDKYLSTVYAVDSEQT